MIDNTKEYILCAAIKHKKCTGDNDIFDMEIGYRHGDIYKRFESRWMWLSRFCMRIGLHRLAIHIIHKTSLLDFEEDGFITNHNRFVDRYEAMRIAVECGQVDAKKAEIGDLTDDERKIFGIPETEDKDYWRRQHNGYPPLFSEDLY